MFQYIQVVVPSKHYNISIGPAIFAGLTTVADQQTDHATQYVTTDLTYVHTTAMWPNKSLQLAYRQSAVPFK